MMVLSREWIVTEDVVTGEIEQMESEARREGRDAVLFGR